MTSLDLAASFVSMLLFVCPSTFTVLFCWMIASKHSKKWIKKRKSQANRYSFLWWSFIGGSVTIVVIALYQQQASSPSQEQLYIYKEKQLLLLHSTFIILPHCRGKFCHFYLKRKKMTMRIELEKGSTRKYSTFYHASQTVFFC